MIATEGNDSGRWRDAIRIFEAAAAEYGWDYSFFIGLLLHVAASAYANELFPHPSHWGSLSFSLTDDFDKAMKTPMVSVATKYNSFGRAEYQVEYWDRPGNTRDLLKWRCQEAQVWPLLESLFLRMEMESRAAHAS